MQSMATIRPFRGILYDKEKIGDFSMVTAPPYDVISSSEQEELYELSDFNVIRLILGKELAGDTDEHNKYTRARLAFQDWLQTNVLRQDDSPSIYIYEQEHELKNGARAKRIGFIALVKLEPLETGRIRPHEKTLSRPKQDRFNLLKTARASFCQIFGLYSDPKNEINPILEDESQAEPEIEVVDNDLVTHRLWRIDKPLVSEAIAGIMSDKTLYIADGHHRYETALKFQDEMMKNTTDPNGAELFNYAMMTLVEMNNQELTVLPIHRVLKNVNENDIRRLTENLKLYFDMETIEFDDDTEENQRAVFFDRLKTRGKKAHVFGMYSGNSKYYLLTLKDEQILDKVLKEKHTKKWKKLDVAILHSLIIDYLLHVKGTDSEIQAHIEHIKDEDEAIELVDSKRFQLAFFLNPTKLDQIKDISSQGEVLPQKSTFFYPKLLSGLVMFRLD